MSRKGFTLVEMLGVIVVLLVLATIVTLKVSDSLKTSKEVAYNKQIEELINVARIYTNQNNVLDDDITVITLDDLKNSKLLKNNTIINPKTKEEMTGCILVRYENNKYNYEYKEDNNECNQ